MKKNKVNMGVIRHVIRERLKELKSQAAWYLYRNIETKHIVSFYYRYRYELVMKKVRALDNALLYLS